MANVSSVDAGVLFLIVLTTFLANGSSSSKDVSQRNEMEIAKQNSLPWSDSGSAASHPGGDACSTCNQSGSRRRAKRCTCYTYKDKECVYYCHLDIIWINTPEHTVLYGMSSYRGSQRMRRSTQPERRRRRRRGAASRRCACALQRDSECSSFCMDRQRRPRAAVPKIDQRTTTPLGGRALT